jgi:predicted dehydrogenase/NADPH:quinone reductase-like Zn-dependent oxidoreductase
MKQLLLGSRVHIADVPAPGLGSKQVLVEVAYSFISTGTEVAGVKSASGGLIAKVKEHPQRVAQVLEMIRVNGVKKTLARVRARLETRGPLGYSCSGRVIAAGAQVQTLAVGDWVACAGMGYASHAEVVAVPINLVAKLPEGCDVRQASGTTVASIALQGVRRADLRLGETVAVVGLGLLGQIALQLFKASGVQVLGFDANPQRVEEARALGFPSCFALTGEQAVNEVLLRTARKGADATLITAATSAPGICQNAIEMTRRKGRVVVVGAVPLEFERDPFYRNEIDFLISGSYGPGRYDPAYEEGGQDYPYAYVRWTENRNMQAIVQMIADGTLRLDRLISAEYAFAEADQAFAALSAEGPARPLGVVLKYDLTDTPSPAKTAKIVALPAPKPHAGKIAVGIIGVGGFCTSTHLPNLAALADRYQIVAVCDRASARAQDVARQCGAAQACSEASDLIGNPDVQLVLVTTQHDTHAPLAIAALRAGKHVFTEKPVAIDETQLRELADLAAGSDRCFMVGYNRRFSPHAVWLRALVAGRAGPLILNYRIMADPAPLESWIYSPAGGGRVIGEACHMLDLFNYLVGDDVATAEVDVVAPPVGCGGPPGDNFVASLRYADGSLATLTYSVLGRKSKENGKERLEALWDGKTFVIDDYVRSFGAGCSAGAASAKKSKGHYEELVALADYLNGKGPRPISWAACARATEQSFVVDAACRGAPATDDVSPA